MKRLAGAFKFLQLGSRPKSRTSRLHARLQDVFARLTTGVAAASLVLAAGTSIRLQRDLSVDTLHSVSAVAPLPVLRSVPSQRLALDPRVSARSPIGLDAALPPFAGPTLVRGRVPGVASAVGVAAIASVAGRGYDATAPPALS